MNNFVHYQGIENYATITINNGKANAISHEVISGLTQALEKAESEKRIVILTGKTGIFSGGFDLNIMKEGPDAAKALVNSGSELVLKMTTFPLPIIAACNGHAIAKGAFLLLACDYRIGSEGNFKIGLNEVMIGMTMHHVGIAIAQSRLAPVYVQRCVNNAEIFNPFDAVIAGFLDKIVPENDLLTTAIKVAKMFGQLNLQAHADTKLRVRKKYISTLKKAIKKDKKSKISINS